MNLTPAELAFIRNMGLSIREKCDLCGKLLNQTVRYTITGRPEVYCSALCRDRVFFDDSREAKKRANPRKCACCGATLERKRRQATFCGHACQMRFHRTGQSRTTRQGRETVTPPL